MSAGRIIVDLLFRTGSFETDTKRSAKALKELKKEAADAGKVLGLAALAYGAVAVTFVKSAIDSADEASKLAVAAGLTTEAFTELAYAADLAGVEQRELSRVFARINTDISKGNKTYAALGVALTDAAGTARTADAVLEDLAEQFAKMPEGAKRTALAIELFGEKIGPKLLPFLVAGKGGLQKLREEAQRLGVAISTDAGKQAEEFNDNLTRLEKLARGVGLSIASALLPSLVKLSEQLVQNARDFGLLQGAAVSFFEWVLGGSDPVSTATRKIASLEAAIAGTKEQILAASDRGDAASVLRESTILEKQEAQLAQLKAQLEFAKGLEDSAKPAATVATQKDAPAVPGDKKVSELQKYLDGLRKQRDGLFEVTVAEQALMDIQSGRLGRLTAAQEAQVLAAANEIDAIRRAQRAAEERAEQRRSEEQAIRDFEVEQEQSRLRRIESFKTEAASLFNATRTPAEKLNIELTRLNGLLEQGYVSWDTYARAVFAAQDAYDAAVDGAKESGEKVKSIGEEIGLAFSSAFEDAIVNGARLSDTLRALEKDIVRLITRKMVTEPLADFVTGLLPSGGPSGGISSMLTSFIGGIFGGGKAGGGELLAGRSYLVGEEGPERFVPRTAGVLLPAAASASEGRQFSQTINFHVTGSIDRRTQMQLAAEAGRAVTLAQLRNM